ncbi:MAG TPA: NCS2 family permease [Alphaproteobacteria bacterium]|nr:NCS2 family permease [Alphaproteobacteria bacterium]
MLNDFFKLQENRTTVRTEIVAGVTTFLTMAYIIFVNPQILSNAGMDRDAVFVATCLAAALSCLIMGLYANYPIALAPGMGLNAYFAFTLVKTMGLSWQVALGAVFISGLLALLLSISPVREWLFNAIPKTLKIAISAGIGLFLGIIALENAGIVVAHPATLVTIGDLTKGPAMLAAFGFILTVALDARRIPGSVIIAILVTTAIGVALGVSPARGIVDTPPSLAPTFLQLDIIGAIYAGLIAVVIVLLFVDLFDTAGTLIGVAHRAGLLAPDGTLPRLRKALIADSSATMIGALLGTSNTTSYIESAAGVKAGGRTGLTAVTVAVLFLLALFLAPLALTVPAYATAPALLFVACLMTRGLMEIDWEDPTEYAPAVITALAMPLTFSIATGIAFGFITYAGIKLIAGRYRDVSAAVAVLAILFLARFAYVGGG